MMDSTDKLWKNIEQMADWAETSLYFVACRKYEEPHMENKKTGGIHHKIFT